MKVEIDLGKLLEYYDRFGRDYDLDSGDGFRAFVLDFVCGYEKEQNEDWADDHTNHVESRLYFNNVLFESHCAAEITLENMKKLIKTDGLVTVADYYIFSNRPAAAIESIFYNWGWRDLNGAYAFSWLDNGHLMHTLKLPDPLPIEHFREQNI